MHGRVKGPVGLSFVHALQEAARRALQDMFKGQKDVLAAYDPGEAVSTSGGGPGGSSGGRGGGISWRPNWREWGDGFWRRARVRQSYYKTHH